MPGFDEKTRNMDGRGFTPYLVITVKVLAKASGRCQETVRRHIKDGSLDPWDMRSIHQWLDKVGRKETEGDK